MKVYQKSSKPQSMQQGFTLLEEEFPVVFEWNESANSSPEIFMMPIDSVILSYV